MTRALCAALLLQSLLTVTDAAQARVFRCLVEDVREPVAGTMEVTDYGRISIGREILFDTERQELTMPGGLRWSFDLLQVGSSENDMVAIREEHGLASVSQMVFRLREWQSDAPFMFVFGWEVQTGRCRPF